MPGNIAFSILTYVLAVALGFFINYLINKLKISIFSEYKHLLKQLRLPVPKI